MIAEENGFAGIKTCKFFCFFSFVTLRATDKG